MSTLRIFKLTDEAYERGIDWSNFKDEDVETVEEIDGLDSTKDNVDDVMYDHGYADTEVYGAQWV